MSGLQTGDSHLQTADFVVGCQNEYQLYYRRKVGVSEKKESCSRCCYEDDLIAKYVGWDTKEEKTGKYMNGTVSLGAVRTSLVEPAAKTRAEHSRSDRLGKLAKEHHCI